MNQNPNESDFWFGNNEYFGYLCELFFKIVLKKSFLEQFFKLVSIIL